MDRKSMGTSITVWLRDAAEELAMAGIATALLDAEVILAHTLRKSRTYLHAHGNEMLDDRRLEIANARLELRKDRVPVAYIIGHKEFYGRQFSVTPSVLIPRPESETLIDQLKLYCQDKTAPHSLTLTDVGTGSGCLGITAKLELPQVQVTLLDTSRHALKVAEQNAKNLDAEVTLLQSDLLTKLAVPSDILVANLPYVDKTWERSPETNHEPAEALFAEDGGLTLIKRLISQTETMLKPGGLLLLEADPEQHVAITAYAKNHGLSAAVANGYCVGFVKP